MIAKLVVWLKQHSLLAGFILMFLFTWPIDLGAAAQSRGWLDLDILSTLALLVGYGFVAAALVMTGITAGKAGLIALLRRFLIWRVGLGWYVVVLLGPAALSLIASGFQFQWGSSPPDFANVYARQIFGSEASLWIFVLPFLLSQLLMNGEEIFMRGYALPRLQARYNALVASLVLGVIWTAWHLPKFLTAGSNQSDARIWLGLLHWLALAILFTWIYNSTRGSLLLVTLFHAAVNTAAIFLPDLDFEITGMVVYWLAAIIVILVAGPATLAGQKPAQVEVGDSTLPVGVAIPAN
jgi:membrane protease YdiL (CAAX protease family)